MLVLWVHKGELLQFSQEALQGGVHCWWQHGAGLTRGLTLHVIFDVFSQINHLSSEEIRCKQGLTDFQLCISSSLDFIFQMGTTRVAQWPCLLCWSQYQDHHLGTAPSSRVRHGPTSLETLELAPRSPSGSLPRVILMVGYCPAKWKVIGLIPR